MKSTNEIRCMTFLTLFLAGNKLSFFLASVEILRRSMWGLLRVEYEHIKFINKKTPGESHFCSFFNAILCVIVITSCIL